ncbi:MAG TPA: CocE/NonD family hydrolase [Steroidobacteraceae bacterium]
MSAPRRRSGALLYRLCLAACLGLACAPVAAQNIDFQPPALAIDPTTPALMRDLAERILPVYQENNPELYLANLSALQLVAGGYEAADATRQSLRDRRRSTDTGPPDGRAVLYDIYAQARATEADAHVPFPRAFAQAFRNALARLSDQNAYAVTAWRGPPLATLQRALQSAFDRERAQGTLSLSDAVDMIWIYLAFDANRSFGPLLGALDTEDDQRRYVTDDHFVIRTRGHAGVSALLVRPRNAAATLPTLLEFTIYADSPNYAKECAAHGYAGVVAYTRLTPHSRYRVLPYQDDGEAARTVIDWIAKQPWSDGRVGMYGGSYSGFTQWAAARGLPPALKAIAASAPTAPGIDFPMRDNIFRNDAYRWVYNVTNKKGWDETYDDARWRALEQRWYQSGLSYRRLDHTFRRPNRFFHRWLNHPSYDGFWQKLIPYRRQFARINIPVLTTAGYYGGDEVGALYYFTQHYRFNPHADQTLLIGPYDDNVLERAPVAMLRGYQVDPAALLDLHQLRYQWFDSIFKGAPRPAVLAGRVNFEVMGANEWRHVASLDAMAEESQRFFLDAATVADAHALAQRKSLRPTFIRQTVSLSDRSDAAWAAPFNVLGKELPIHNGVKFVSDPLPQPLELNGLFSGRLDFTVNKMDMDLYVALYELTPAGDYLELFDPPFEFRASYARDRVHRHLLKAGERQQLDFRSDRLTSRKLQAGSRLVVVLGVSKRPDQEINYGGGDDVSVESVEDGKEAVKIRWYSDSYIDFPVRK